MAEKEVYVHNAVGLEVEMLPVINYCLQQNRVAAIQAVTVENTTGSPLENLTLRITATPEFALPFARHMDFLPAGKTVTLVRPELILSGEYLAGMTEKVTGILHFCLECDGRVLSSRDLETTVLAFDEWHGLGMHPELLSAFVTPNHPEVAKIIGRATEFMGKWTGDTSMDAYQSQDPNRVLSQAAAIFTAIKEQAIAYAVPPASFEKAGQRVRLCDMVLQQKLGTCLDLTLLYAACLEAVGLHPLLISTVGHIFTGLWLEDKMFPESVQDDFSMITKRLASGVNEIAVVETTAVTTGADRSFDDARRLGEENMVKQQVEYIIDVRRARLSGISPLPQRVQAGDRWRLDHDITFRKETMAAPTQLEESVYIDPNAPEASIPKKMLWERKLLDLGLRNTLINLRFTKTQLPILTGSLDELENALADGSEYTILPRPADMQVTELTFETMFETGTSGIIQAEFQNKRLRCVLSEAELAKAIKELYRAAKTALEENGANTLYLALGMLRWFETARSTKPRYAPIILVPIEMVRKSAAQGYVIRLRDEEPQINVTMLEKLKQDFGIVVGGLDPLPVDEHGIDIRRVLTILRKAVMEQPRWDVLENASIGIFSFSQFVMWNDIRNRTEDLLRNKVVRSLMDGKLSWDAQPLEMGEKVDENNVLLPMSADASQLFAIRTACQGESFVLHGPPGTGKSQTITSLIANALAQGKRVLFVAEKMAALEVVQKRLDKIGIGPFCLELHSNKSKKKDVLEQLRQASEVTKSQTGEEYAAKAEQLAALRAELDSYARQLHRSLPCGSDLYTLINDYEPIKEAPELTPFDRSFLETLTRSQIESHILLVERIIAAGRAVGHPSGHPLEAVACPQYSQSLRSSLQTTAQAYEARCQGLLEPVAQLSAALGETKPRSWEALRKLSEIAAQLVCWYHMPPAWARTDCPQLYFEEIGQLAQHSATVKALEERLLSVFEPGIMTQDGSSLFREFAEASEKWFLPKTLAMNKLAKKLNVYAKQPLDKSQLHTHITALRDHQAEKAAADGLFEKYGQALGVLYSGKNTDWEKIARLAARAQAGAQALYNLQGSYDWMNRLGGSQSLKAAVLALSEDFGAFVQAKADFDGLLHIEEKMEENWLAGQITLCQGILAQAHQLKEWIAYVSATGEARAAGLGNVVSGYEAGISHEDILPAYRKALLQGLISGAIDGSDTLGLFSGAVFNEKIAQFQRLDSQWAQLSQQEIYCRLASQVPNFTREAAHSSELGILQRCIKSGGRGVSIRRLFDQIPNLLPRLCPCMLMSPISAAQYLDPKRAPFDIVVFDEASQLPTCKAVGVLARGENAIIVGDPKQMPPTSFFAANSTDEDNLETEDLESILDDCLALNMPQSHLLWHYRSRHESLIAFSNSQFYENKLFTFPSVNDRVSKVSLCHVDGVFDRGKTRTNRAEARAVVEEIKRRFADPRLSGQSLGVVTFNIQQQHLIDDLLNEACSQDPELEKWVYGAQEPVFIKNLENVQGDERDVILFSIGFGPDEKGKVYMNFGPLNRDGGWRRLNVAVSRSRCEMMVFSTLRPEQLDLNRTQAEGVAALKRFLEYAQGRSLALESAQAQRGSADGIAQAICKALETQGYDTDLSVGRSEYRIDIAVADPQNPQQYLLGILLDGDAYGTAKTTRDRELAQIGVLKGLGWNIQRIWCMDWWDNREKELERILQALRDIRAGVPKTEIPAPETPAPVLAQITPVKVKSAPLYQAVQLPQKQITAEEFVEPKYTRGIQSRITAVIAGESPISLGLLTKRVVQSYGITRAGTRIQGHLATILQGMGLKSTLQGDVQFYWNQAQVPEVYMGFRVSGEGDDRRDVRDVPQQEVANAICTVLHEQISMAQEDLLRETARKLGYTRLGGNVLSALELGIRYAEERECITLAGNGAYVLTAAGTARAEDTIASF